MFPLSNLEFQKAGWFFPRIQTDFRSLICNRVFLILHWIEQSMWKLFLYHRTIWLIISKFWRSWLIFTCHIIMTGKPKFLPVTDKFFLTLSCDRQKFNNRQRTNIFLGQVNIDCLSQPLMSKQNRLTMFQLSTSRT